MKSTSRTIKRTVVLSLVLLVLGSICLTVGQNTRPAYADAILVYPVDATFAAGGVFARYGPHVAATNGTVGYGIYPNEQVELLCGVTDGDAVGPYNNQSWHFVTDLSNTAEGNFWVSDHYLDTPIVANQLVPSEATCPNESSNPLQPAGTLPCTPLLVIGVQGSGGSYAQSNVDRKLWGFGSTLRPLVQGLIQYYGTNNVTSYGLPYAADPMDLHHLNNTIFYSDGYKLSLQGGISTLTSTLNAQVQACQSQQMIDLIGYSQGADVVNSTIPLLSQPVRNQINGVATFGDPLFNASNAEDRGSYNHMDNGIRASTVVFRPRPELSSDMLAKARSYCDDTDFVCNFSSVSIAAGLLGKSAHFTYGSTHVPEAEQFLESLTNVSTGTY